MKKKVFLIIILVFIFMKSPFILKGAVSYEIQHYQRYISSLLKLGLYNIASEKLEYAFKRFGVKKKLLLLKIKLLQNEGKEEEIKILKNKYANLLNSVVKVPQKKILFPRSKLSFNKKEKDSSLLKDIRSLKARISSSKKHQSSSKNWWKKVKKKLYSLRYYSYFVASIGFFVVLPPI